MLRDGVKDFQQHGKREFVSYEQDVPVQVTWRNINDDLLDIERGTMVIPGYLLPDSIVNEGLKLIRYAFQPSCPCVLLVLSR